jgi:hypothetical protein
MEEDYKPKLVPAKDDFVDYMHKSYPDPDGLPFRTAMLLAHDYIVGNYHEMEKVRKQIGEKIRKKMEENNGRQMS